ncbi:MAG: glycosyltransferase [Chloroflexi bacterium]|nr:glycosyltransferase [Chloroflexota bacterium]MDL1882167.1 glycosyltransferase family 2 protein [Anaerolineae bacterium CFX8]
MMPSLSVVIPVYNGALSLPELVSRLGEELPKLTDAFELIFVEDDGRDNSWEVIQQLVRQRPWIRGFKHMRNYGQHNALLCGIRAARYEVIVTMDDDLQHPPEEIRRLLDKLAEGYDAVYGTPHHEQHGFFRDMASQVTKIALQSAMGVDVARSVSAFRVFRTQLRDAFANYQSPYVSIDVLLTWGTKRFAAIPVRHDPRKLGISNYTLRKLVTHALNMMTGFSILPLQIASLVGFALTMFGVIVLVYVIGRALIENAAPAGFPFLASTIAVFSGAQLFALGIMGEYLARMHVRIMGQPSSVVREVVEYQPQAEMERETAS